MITCSPFSLVMFTTIVFIYNIMYCTHRELQAKAQTYNVQFKDVVAELSHRVFIQFWSQGNVLITYSSTLINYIF